MKTKNHVFSNKDITVTYNPKICINAERCALELSNVFRQSVIPWIDLEADSNENIINQVKKCPSGALQFCMNKKEAC
tara:strand:- start:119 stop:349 length:231 start_codon:yes stop_codon:yes gene_type:complete